MMRPRSVQRLLLPGIILAGLIVRLWHVGRADLWTDEILFVWLSAPPMNPWDVVVNQWERLLIVTHLPLPEVIQNIVLWAAHGRVEDVTRIAWLNRLPALIFGVLTIPAIHKLAMRVLNDASAAWSATLMVAFFVLPVYYAREAYYYAPLIFFSTVTLCHLAALLGNGQPQRKTLILFALAGTGMAYSHMSGIVFMALITVGLGLVWLAGKARTPETRLVPGKLVGLAALPLLMISPWVLKLALNKVQSATSASGLSVSGILFDVCGKFFMGSQLGWNWLAVALLLTGFAGLFLLGGERRATSRFMAGLLIVGLLVMGISTYKTQYHVRYFSVLTPLMYVCFAAGLLTLARAIFKSRAAGAVSFITGVFIAIQLLIYMPAMLRLESKSVDFGRIADWINQHVPEGGTFLLESAYELRFISGYHPTPGRVGAAPYVHGDLATLHQRQQAFMRQFPEAPWVESARHNMDQQTELGGWTWPHERFRQRVDLRNEPLARMSSLGIHLSPGRRAAITELWTPIWYNTHEDRLLIAREEGAVIITDYPGWTINGQQIAPNATDYFRIAPGTISNVQITRVTDEPVTGDLLATLAIIAESPSETITLRLTGQPPVSYNLTPGQFTQVPLRGVALTEPETTLEIRHRGGNVRALLVRDIQMQRVN